MVMVCPQHNAHAKKLVWHYTKLQQEYQYHMLCCISRLRKQFWLFALLSKDSGLLSEMSSLSSNLESSTHGLNSDRESEESTSDDSWADILGSD